jgi:hypothetical protein
LFYFFIGLIACQFAVNVPNMFPESFDAFDGDYIFGSITGRGLTSSNGDQVFDAQGSVILGVRTSYNPAELMVVAIDSLEFSNASYVSFFNEAFVNVRSYTHNSPRTLFNDLTQLSNGDVYITDSFEGAIYYLNSTSTELSVYLVSSLLDAPLGAFGADGIDNVYDGDYLIVSNCNDGTLLRVDLSDSSIQAINGDFNSDDTFFCPDGVRKVDDENVLVVTNNLNEPTQNGALWHLRSDDEWVSAVVVKKIELLSDECPVPTAVVPPEGSNEALVLCSGLNFAFSGQNLSEFSVQSANLGSGKSKDSASILGSIF